MKYSALISLILFFSGPCFAVTIEFPDDELAQESVYPVFLKPQAVKSKNVELGGRFELGGGLSLNLGEALYQQISYNFTGTYYLNESAGINVFGYVLTQGLSNTGTDLKNGKGLSVGSFDASRAPQLQGLYFANYQMDAYYGKISLTKKAVMNLSLFGLVGAGVAQFEDTTNFGLNVGIGQRFYFTDSVALRFDLNLTAYQGPDPTTKFPLLNGGAKLSSSDFDQTLHFRSFLAAAITFLL